MHKGGPFFCTISNVLISRSYHVQQQYPIKFEKCERGPWKTLMQCFAYMSDISCNKCLKSQHYRWTMRQGWKITCASFAQGCMVIISLVRFRKYSSKCLRFWMWLCRTNDRPLSTDSTPVCSYLIFEMFISIHNLEMNPLMNDKKE